MTRVSLVHLIGFCDGSFPFSVLKLDSKISTTEIGTMGSQRSLRPVCISDREFVKVTKKCLLLRQVN